MAEDEGTRAALVTESGAGQDRGHPPAAAHRTAAHRRRPGRDSDSSGHRACQCDPHQSGCRRIETGLRQLRAAGRAECRRPAWAQRRRVSALRHVVLVLTTTGGRRVGGRPVRRPGLHRPRRRRLDLSGDRPQRERSVGGAQGPAPAGRTAGAGDRPRRTSIPRHGEPSRHRQDLQLRRTPGFRRSARSATS